MLSLSIAPHLYLSLLLSLSFHSSVLSCWTASERRCNSAPFIPGYNLMGSGFDVVTLQRKGNNVFDVGRFLSPIRTCRVCYDPYQDYNQYKIPLYATKWRTYRSCSTYVSSKSHTSVSSLASALANEISPDWKMGLNMNRFHNLEVGGTRSTVANFATTKSKEDRYIFSTQSATCIRNSYSLSESAPLRYTFRWNMETLPTHYQYSAKLQYRRFINVYGTHYIHKVYLGGRVRRITAARTCLCSLNDISTYRAHSCLSLGVNIGLGNSKLPTNVKPCIKVALNLDTTTFYSKRLHEHFTEVVGGRGWTGRFYLTFNNSLGHRYWMRTLRAHPEVVRYSLKPLYELESHWLRRLFLKASIEEYLRNNALRSQPSRPSCPHSTNLDYNCCPKQIRKGRLVVTIIRAWRLTGDGSGLTEAYAKMWYGSIYRKTRMIRSNYPYWGSRFDLGTVDTRSLLKIEVWDEDWRRDELLGLCLRYVYEGTRKFTCYARSGRVEVSYTLTCDRHLTGIKCHQYKPSPL